MEMIPTGGAKGDFSCASFRSSRSFLERALLGEESFWDGCVSIGKNLLAAASMVTILYSRILGSGRLYMREERWPNGDALELE